MKNGAEIIHRLPSVTVPASVFPFSSQPGVEGVRHLPPYSFLAHEDAVCRREIYNGTVWRCGQRSHGGIWHAGQQRPCLLLSSSNMEDLLMLAGLAAPA